MKIRWFRFNIYLLLATLVVGAACGCKSSHRKQLSTLRLYIEVNPDASNMSQSVAVYRAQPFSLNVSKEAFLSEKNIAQAKVIDEVGGFGISIRFDRQGAWLLNSYSTQNHGLHFAIQSQWMDKPGDKLNKGRWLAAPKILTGINNGNLTFTPDATREEADAIVAGLNNVAKKLDTASELNW
jgi:hypothetical protein